MNLLAVILLISMSAMTIEAQYGYSYYGYRPFAYSYASSYFFKRNFEMGDDNKADCAYVKTDDSFRCFNNLGEVKCKVEWKFDEVLDMDKYAIGQMMDKKFNLYPKTRDDSTWNSNIIKSKGETYNMSIHSGESKDYGIMVKEAKCFKKLTMLFADSKLAKKIHLEDTHTDVVAIGNFAVVVRMVKPNKYEDFEEDFVVERDYVDEEDFDKRGHKMNHHKMKHSHGHKGRSMDSKDFESDYLDHDYKQRREGHSYMNSISMRNEMK